MEEVRTPDVCVRGAAAPQGSNHRDFRLQKVFTDNPDTRQLDFLTFKNSVNKVGYCIVTKFVFISCFGTESSVNRFQKGT